MSMVFEAGKPSTKIESSSEDVRKRFAILSVISPSLSNLMVCRCLINQNGCSKIMYSFFLTTKEIRLVRVYDYMQCLDNFM